VRDWSLPFIAAICGLILVVPHAHGDAPITQPVAAPQTGEFTTTFTERSSQSAYSKLPNRLNATASEIGADYDLSKVKFSVYVPADYDASKPMGLVVYINDNNTDAFPKSIEPALDQHHLIFIIPGKAQPSPCETMGLSLDGVYNIERQYKVDPRRIYLMGQTGYVEATGLCGADVFTGAVYIWYIGYFHTIPVGGNSFYAPTVHPPPANMLDWAKSRVQILGFEEDVMNDGLKSRIPPTMQHDGFDHVFKELMLPNQIGYPNFDPVLFEKIITDLETVPLDKVRLPSIRQIGATSQPAVVISEPDRLLKLAQAYINAGAFELARGKLNAIIQQYPNDPAAQKAQDLLTQIQGK